MKKNILIFMLILSLLSVVGCNKNNDNNVEGIAYASLERSEQTALSDKHGVVKKVEFIPDNATILDKNYKKEKLYSVSFKYDTGDKIVIFIDTKNNKKVGMLMSQ
ncbi:hypothetical protein [Bacillus sp. EAC]|uniref:hypothetical protein n=1 Tax=Bacillus sp. EAC TaxID=1978338 RepID=UPI000B43E48D|nr:hypothetical protein [Bacillus sp. EAC]